jgi:L-fuculose-phosphate aldolase
MPQPAFDDSARAALVAAARAVAEAGLVIATAGNLSVRSGERVLITPRGCHLEAVDPRTCVEIALADHAVVDNGVPAQPSSESALHCAVYGATDAGAIVHTHSHYATVLSTLVDELPPIHYAIHALGGTVRVARYETFGTEALASAVAEAMEGRRGALMANHGAIVAGRDLDHAVHLAITLEWLAGIYYDAIVAGSPAILDETDIDAVRERVAAR